MMSQQDGSETPENTSDENEGTRGNTGEIKPPTRIDMRDPASDESERDEEGAAE